MLVICNFHYIREHFNNKYPSFFGITPTQFSAQLDSLAQVGEFIHPNALVELLEDGLPLSKNYILLTFDDGLKEQYDMALPILKEKGIPATFFVNTENVEFNKTSLVHKIHTVRSVVDPIILKEKLFRFLKETDKMTNLRHVDKGKQHYRYDTPENAEIKYILNFCMSIDEQKAFINEIFTENFGQEDTFAKALYMNHEQLNDLSELGLLGSHSHSHVPLGLYSESEIRQELQSSKDYLEQRFNKRIDLVSYPYGGVEACKNPVPEVAREVGYKIGLTMNRNVNNGLQTPLSLNRFDNNDLPGGKYKNLLQWQKSY